MLHRDCTATCLTEVGQVAQTRNMRSRIEIAVVFVVATAILVLFVLPAFDVNPTALRSARAAALLMLSMALAASSFFAFRFQASKHLQFAYHRAADHPDLLRVTCSLLC